MRSWAHIAMAAVLQLSASPGMVAQQFGFSIGPPPVFPTPSRGTGLTISFQARPAQAFHHSFLLPLGFYNYPFWSSDSLYPPMPGEFVAPSAPVVVVQPAQQVMPEQQPAQLLLIERRGDRFVRVRDTESDRDVQNAQNESQSSVVSKGSASLLTRSQEPLLTVLVFRDGSREETASYTIADGVLYESTDYWSTGAWSKKVNLALLDLPATVRENQVRGVKFMLPLGPHEVVVR
jgi:hypothetical protein